MLFIVVMLFLWNQLAIRRQLLFVGSISNCIPHQLIILVLPHMLIRSGTSMLYVRIAAIEALKFRMLQRLYCGMPSMVPLTLLLI